jgi:hypothetical protein
MMHGRAALTVVLSQVAIIAFTLIVPLSSHRERKKARNIKRPIKGALKDTIFV